MNYKKLEQQLRELQETLSDDIAQVAVDTSSQLSALLIIVNIMFRELTANGLLNPEKLIPEVKGFIKRSKNSNFNFHLILDEYLTILYEFYKDSESSLH